MFQHLKNILLVTMCSYPLYAHALKEDRNEKIYIVADSTIYNSTTGVSVFVGHVKADQGTTHIVADRLTTKANAQHKLEEITAFGDQELAHYWTVPKPNDKELHARAKIIRFYPVAANVTLEQNVLLTQGENSFHGDLIHYNSYDQTINVPFSKNGRSTLIYNPDN